jgi:hypothetical protein
MEFYSPRSNRGRGDVSYFLTFSGTMKPRTKEFIPVMIKTSFEGPFSWGRILEIYADSCKLMSKFEFKKGKIAALCFDFENEKIEDLRGTITHVEKDRDGYFIYQIKFTDEVQKSRMRKKLFEILSKT